MKLMLFMLSTLNEIDVVYVMNSVSEHDKFKGKLICGHKIADVVQTRCCPILLTLHHMHVINGCALFCCCSVLYHDGGDVC